MSSLLARGSSLTLLVLQNTAYVLLTRYSRAVRHETYITATVVVWCELLKFVLATLVALWQHHHQPMPASMSMSAIDATPADGQTLLGAASPASSPSDHQTDTEAAGGNHDDHDDVDDVDEASSTPAAATVGRLSMTRYAISVLCSRDAALMLLPSTLYIIMNQLAYVSLELLPASTYLLLQQTRVVYSAVFARILLHKQLNAAHWRAIVLLMLGVALLQMHGAQCPAASTPAAGVSTAGGTISVQEADALALIDRGLPSNATDESSQPAPGVHVTHVDHAGVSSPALVPRARPDALGRSVPVLDRLPVSLVSLAGVALGAAAGPAWLLAWRASVSTHLLGVMATLATAGLSALAACLVEKMLKAGAANAAGSSSSNRGQHSPAAAVPAVSMWERNMQLSSGGFLLSLLQVCLLVSDSDLVRIRSSSSGWLVGYTPLCLLLIVLSSLGGLLVAHVLRHLDNLIRNFASGIGVILTALVSHALWHDQDFSATFAVGAIVIAIAAMDYQYAQRKMDEESDREKKFNNTTNGQADSSTQGPA